MFRQIINSICLVIVLIWCGLAIAGGLGLDLTLELSSTGGGAGGSPPICSTGYDQLTGSDSNSILDSTGAPICTPQ